MRCWIFGLLLCVALLVSAESFKPYERAGVTKTINDVSVLPRKTKAVLGDVISGDLALKTGGNSRAELEFPDFTITRVGSNALFRFLAGQRQIILDGDTMLFSSPKGGGGKVEAGAITAAVTGTDFLISLQTSHRLLKLRDLLLLASHFLHLFLHRHQRPPLLQRSPKHPPTLRVSRRRPSRRPTPRVRPAPRGSAAGDHSNITEPLLVLPFLHRTGESPSEFGNSAF
jgi:hypothetical protein